MKTFRKNPAKAFTVVELLIVMAVVAILAAIVLPALARPRGCVAQRINCANNLKQVGLAFKLWDNDNGKYPMQMSVTNGGTMELVNNGAVFVHFLAMSNELSTPKVLFCPEETDPSKKVATSFEQSISPTLSNQSFPFTNDNYLSYFVGVDADDGPKSVGRLLSGDWNLAIGSVPVKHGLYKIQTNAPVSWVGARHGKKGNICLADGSVQQVDASGLRSLLIQSGVATNRLAIP
jgi:prepilin-type N-terminal cleavage/methylation domain-containing protein/prepilin-type processing-associated H-X9-DG protein